MPSSKPLRVASVNVNGVRAAFRKGMREWLAARDVDILAMQEVRASTEDLHELLGDEWDVLHVPATAKGRAGVAIASRAKATIHRVELGDPKHDFAGPLARGRLRGRRPVDHRRLHLRALRRRDGPKQRDKYRFLDAMTRRLPELQAHSELALVVGDLNVGHRELDIRNWKGNRTKAGFLPKERAYFDRILSPAGKRTLAADGVKRVGLGWVDVGRTWSAARSTARTRGGRRWARRSTTTRDGASTTTSQRPRSRPPSSTTPSTARPPTTSAGATTPPSSSTTRL